ncbi:MAG: hypothetical protein IPO26_13670 [Saprospiraceae bacterium]|nr:hypothetical protein [Saprospiraceae bacterium]
MEKRLTAAVQNGISLKSELNNIKVEQINVATQRMNSPPSERHSPRS